MKKLKAKYLVVGDINVDLIFKGVEAPPALGQEIFVPSMDFCLGGSAANTACALSKLGSQLDLWANIAQDEFGLSLLRLLHKAGVNQRYIQQVPNQKSGISIALTNHRDRAFISYPGTNKLLDITQIKNEVLVEHTHIHASGFDWEKNLPAYVDLFQRAKNLGLSTSLDLGWTDFDRYRTRLWQLLTTVDYFFPNEPEALTLTQASDLSTALKFLGERTAVPIITLGRKGALTLWQGKEYYQPSFNVESVDSVGAGDAFDAGFLWAIGEGKNPPEALKIANACGALTTTSVGGGEASPTKDQLQAFLKTQEHITEGSEVS